MFLDKRNAFDTVASMKTNTTVKLHGRKPGKHCAKQLDLISPPNPKLWIAIWSRKSGNFQKQRKEQNGN
jgi:hypothetical protein